MQRNNYHCDAPSLIMGIFWVSRFHFKGFWLQKQDIGEMFFSECVFGQLVDQKLQ